MMPEVVFTSNKISVPVRAPPHSKSWGDVNYHINVSYGKEDRCVIVQCARGCHDRTYLSIGSVVVLFIRSPKYFSATTTATQTYLKTFYNSLPKVF